MSAADRHLHNSHSHVSGLSAGLCGLMLMCAPASGAQAGESAAALVASFQTLCMAGPLDFAGSEQKAAAMQLSIQQSIGAPPDDSGYFSHSKSWTVIGVAPHEFVVSESHGPKGDFKSCGIRSADIDAADFKAELAKTLKLGKPLSEGMSSDGQRRNLVWSVADRTLTLSDRSPQNVKQGVRLLLSNKPL